ncbi:uncharacterized protein LOC122542276 [Chiloscyllium plagiosum]|uniref:uncharacterized protein LOC122542276 n=1 Tax=Chiloscyllium plagiosum TaxID=36176 RepID=UPI001CB7C61E|nr:uncharacterized protein LOC122542276 [Chiloscyllium plagiosum]
MGNKVSGCVKKEAARNLYVKMMKKGAYEQDIKSMKYTKKILEQATIKGLESILDLILKLKVLPAAFCMTGLGAIILAGCVAVDLFRNNSENVSEMTENAVRKILHEESIQEISNLIIAYQNRYEMFANNKKKLCEEVTIYERDLFNQLNRASQNMLKYPRSATVSNFLAWLKGARMYLEMLSDMVYLGVIDSSAVVQVAHVHCVTMSELALAVKKQKRSVIHLFRFPLGISLTDKEAGHSVCVYYPHFSFNDINDIKDQYLTLLLDDQLKSVKEQFKSLIIDFQKNSWAKFTKYLRTVLYLNVVTSRLGTSLSFF